MGRNTSIVLGEHFLAFINHEIAEGRYASASEVVRAGLRLLEDEETKLAAVRAALAGGEASGPAAAFNPEAFLDRMHGSTARRA